MASASELRGGASYPEPFKSIIGAFDFLTLDLFSVLHLACIFGSANYMANVLVAALWPILATMISLTAVSTVYAPTKISTYPIWCMGTTVHQQ